jgi:RimJ/RimL family protein N-acetyltransferase
MSATPILHTDRLTLREMTVDDLDFIAAMLAHPEVMRYYPKQLSRDEALEWIERQIGRYEQDGHGMWLVHHRYSGHPLGQAGLVARVIEEQPETEIGYLLHRPFWGKGFASEAAAAIRDYAFERLKRRRVISLIRPANMPSRKVAERIGMRAEKTTIFAELPHLVYAKGITDA